MVASWRAAKRLLGLLWLIVQGVREVHGAFHRLSAAQQHQRIERWAQRFLAQAGVRLRVQGAPIAQAPVLIVANHQSWLDIPALHAARACRFVSKAEVAQWPLVGVLAQAAGTLFVQRRARRATLSAMQAMAQGLQAGETFALFPEGTVSDGHALLPFHGNMLQAAIDADAPIQPVAMWFEDADSGALSFVPCEAYLHEPLVRSLWRTLRQPRTVAVLHYGAPQKAQGRDRRQWAQALQQQVQTLHRPSQGSQRA